MRDQSANQRISQTANQPSGSGPDLRGSSKRPSLQASDLPGAAEGRSAGREARRRAWGEDEHSPQWRGEACRTCRFWTGCVCLDDWEAYRSCPVGRPQETTGVGRSPTAPAKLPSLQASKPPKPGPSGHGVRLFDF